MAEACGKATGRPGICFVTRGPGATNASVGVHTAFQDSTPMILFIGQVARDQMEREAFQEIDYRRMFGQMAKWVAQIDRTERIRNAEQLLRAVIDSIDAGLCILDGDGRIVDTNQAWATMLDRASGDRGATSFFGSTSALTTTPSGC